MTHKEGNWTGKLENLCGRTSRYATCELCLEIGKAHSKGAYKPSQPSAEDAWQIADGSLIASAERK